jgi:uncharacterized membrane protein YoaK (UPF0700 family)
MTEPVEASSSVRRRAAPPLAGLRRALLDELHGPLPALLLSLTVLAGVVDAASILRLGHVFVATMTGNLVFLGLAAAGAKGFAVLTPALALAGSVVGVLVGSRVCSAAGSHRGVALRNVLAVKLCFAGTVTLLAILTGPHLPTGIRDTMVVLLAISMGAQLATIRYLRVPDLLTVVLTFTITGALVERRRGWRDPTLLRRCLALVAFILGALSGALLILYVGIAAALFFGMAIILSVMIGAHLVSRNPGEWAAPRSA